MPSDEIILTHYRLGGGTRLRSITALPREASFALAHALRDARACTSTRRFGEDYTAYYAHRLRAEQWLYEGVTRIGLRPQTRCPLYFTVGDSDMLDNWFDHGEALRVPLSLLPERAVSFTLGDSMTKLNAPERRPPFDARELRRRIADAGGLSALLAEIEPVYRYIEAQVWLPDIDAALFLAAEMRV